MKTRWATIDGVHLEIPVEITPTELREYLHKPADAALIAVTGDLVSVIHADDCSLSTLIAGCADTYYFVRDADPERDDVLSSPKVARALSNPDEAETTFQRPELDP